VAELSTVLNKSTEVLSLTPDHLSDVLEDIRRVGRATGVEQRADSLTAELLGRIDAVVSRANAATHQPRVLQLEWADPLLCGGHWVVEMVELAGGVPCFGSKDAGSSRLIWDDVINSQPELVLFMPCGFGLERALEDVPLLTSLPGWNALPAVRNGQVFVLDAGAYTSRLGPRLITGLEIMAEIIHPEIFSGMTPSGSVLHLEI
jgi:iron complex transport system substrate-binding protein